MTLRVEDFCGQTTLTEGTGPYTTGAPIGEHALLNDKLEAGNWFYGTVKAVDALGNLNGGWETGKYTKISDNLFERTEIHSSSNNGQAVSWGVGKKHMLLTLTAYQLRYLDPNAVTTPPTGGGGGTGGTPTTIEPYGRPAGVYTSLKYAEEFNGVSLDTARWVPRNFYSPENPTVNYKVEAGALHIWPQTDSAGAFFSRVVETRGLYTRGYGYVEIEAAMPVGRGLRPVLGLHNSDGGVPKYIEMAIAQPGETDYNTAGVPDNYLGYLFHTNTVSGSRTLKPTVTNADLTQMHKYGVHWDSTGIEWFFDGTSLGRFATTLFNGLVMYVTLALEMNTGGIAVADPNNNSITPQGSTNALKVNYVRAWDIVAESTGGGTIDGTIDWYGDSTVYGWDYLLNGTINEGDPVATPMPAAFHATAPVTSGVNRGVNGAKAADYLNGTNGVSQTWATHLASNTAKWLILQCREITTSSALITNLTSLVDQAKTAGKIVIIQTAIPSDNAGTLTHTEIATAQRQVASATGVALMDLHAHIQSYIAANGLTYYQTLGDTQHPKAEYYIAWGQWCKQRFLEIVGVADNPPQQTGYVAPLGQSANDYPKIIFRDEFDSGTAPSAAKWPLQKMWYEGAQYANRGNIDVNGGNLRMWAKPWSTSTDPLVRYPNEGGYYKNHNATLCTDGVFEFRYGFVEFKAKLPRGQGPFPALWLYSHRDMAGNEVARRQEIDVMEAYPSGTAYAGWSSLDSASADNRPINTVATVWFDEGQQLGYRKGNDVGLAYGTDLSLAMHTYGVRWDATGVQFYFDGSPFGTKIVSNQMTNPMYLLIDYWMGGESGLPNNPPGTLVETSENSLEVEYVRVWSLADGSTTAIGSAVEP